MPIVRQMFDAASSILEFDLAETCLKGPKQLLSQTQVQQPAIFVASLAAVEKWVKNFNLIGTYYDTFAILKFYIVDFVIVYVA